MTDESERRVWLVERTYSDDEQNVVILTYATPDGKHDFRRERALTSFSGPSPEVALSLTVPDRNLGTVSDPEERARYRTEVERLMDEHDPDDVLG
ncbi:hypothetical protein [Natronorarus salvus]|uniref:hypothetical protein n=1 Tax=Natronorarus salvus TaxID=3117733 RepID=UPI002F2623CE